CGGAEKNDLRFLWPIPSGLVRPQTAARPRPVLRRYARLRGIRSATRGWPTVRCREARETAVAGGQPLLHQALRLLRGAPLPQFGAARCGARIAPRLEDSQKPR